MKGIDMKTLCIAFLLVVIVLGCNGQVQVPSADIQPVLDSLVVLKARVAVLEAKPSVNVQPFLDSIAVLKARVAELEDRAVETMDSTVTLAAGEFRKAVYIPGINSSWKFIVDNRTTVDNPVFGFLDKQVKTDTLVILCQSGGPARLVDCFGIKRR